MNTAFFISLALFFWGLLATGRFFVMRARAREALAEREHLEGWVHHNLRAIRAGTEYAFPEAVSVCNSLEMALPLRARVDVKQLDQHLARLRREHNVRVLDGAGVKTADASFEQMMIALVSLHLGVPVSAIDLVVSDSTITVRVKGGAS